MTTGTLTSGNKSTLSGGGGIALDSFIGNALIRNTTITANDAASGATVPFNGGGPAIASTVAGHTTIAFASPAAAVPQVTDGKLRALAVASKARLASLPDVRTLAEAGHADVECNVWVGLLVPAGAPREIVTLLHRVTGEIVALPDVRHRLDALGFAPFAPALDAMAGQLREESAKWARLVRATGIKAE